MIILNDSPQRVKRATLQMFCKFSVSSSVFLSPIICNFPFSTRTYLIWNLNFTLLQKPFGNLNDLSKKMFGFMKMIKMQVKYKLKHSMTGNTWAWWKGISCKQNFTCTSSSHLCIVSARQRWKFFDIYFIHWEILSGTTFIKQSHLAGEEGKPFLFKIFM